MWPACEAFGPEDAGDLEGYAELDLVGTWGLNWFLTSDPGEYTVVIDIDSNGDMTWTESNGDCSTSVVSTGCTYVSGNQLVFRFETTERTTLPWEVDTDLAGNGGADPNIAMIEVPYEFDVTYSLGGNALTFVGPPGLVETEPYAGGAYIVTNPKGPGNLPDDQSSERIGDVNWGGEANFYWIPDGETDPALIARDSNVWALPPDNLGIDMADPNYSVASAPWIADDAVGGDQYAWSRVRNYWYVDTPPYKVPAAMDGSDFKAADWNCPDPCPAIDAGGGNVYVGPSGGVLYKYLQFRGRYFLHSFGSMRAFQKGTGDNCGG